MANFLKSSPVFSSILSRKIPDRPFIDVNANGKLVVWVIIFKHEGCSDVFLYPVSRLAPADSFE